MPKTVQYYNSQLKHYIPTLPSQDKATVVLPGSTLIAASALAIMVSKYSSFGQDKLSYKYLAYIGLGIVGFGALDKYFYNPAFRANICKIIYLALVTSNWSSKLSKPFTSLIIYPIDSLLPDQYKRFVESFFEILSQDIFTGFVSNALEQVEIANYISYGACNTVASVANNQQTNTLPDISPHICNHISYKHNGINLLIKTTTAIAICPFKFAAIEVLKAFNLEELNFIVNFPAGFAGSYIAEQLTRQYDPQSLFAKGY